MPSAFTSGKKKKCGQVSVSLSCSSVDFSLMEHLFCKWIRVDLVRILESTTSLEDQLLHKNSFFSLKYPLRRFKE